MAVRTYNYIYYIKAWNFGIIFNSILDFFLYFLMYR